MNSAQALPEALAFVFSRTNLTGNLVQSVKASIAESMLPHLTTTSRNIIDATVSELRSEVLGVRKEMASEQTTSLELLTNEVQSLRQAVRNLEAAYVSSTASESPAMHPNPKASAKQARRQLPERPHTPVENYEDLLLAQLSANNGANDLTEFIESSPPHRRFAIFPNNARPVISQVSRTIDISCRCRDSVDSITGCRAQLGAPTGAQSARPRHSRLPVTEWPRTIAVVRKLRDASR